MAVDPAVLDFTRQLRSEALDSAPNHPQGAFPERVFTDLVLDELAALAEVQDPTECWSERKIKNAIASVNGFGLNEDGDALDLFVTLWREAEQPPTVARDEVQSALRRAERYAEFALSGELLARSDSAHEDYAMLARINEAAPSITRIRFVVLTNGQLQSAVPFNASVERRKTSVEVWDAGRLLRARQSGSDRNSIQLTLSPPLPCLPMPKGETDYEGYLVIVPGDLLHSVYEEYGERLLELNVRSFLQARGKVNQGIRDTLRTDAGSFFAYNNGLSAVAEKVVLDGDVKPAAIKQVMGLQIVNGGQTTASIHRAKKMDHADLSRVFVQMKLIVVPSTALETVVPRISRNANSQNKVNDADFSANDPFHRRIEDLSRTVWAPGMRTKWFYERARGQYQVAKAKTPGRGFETVNPASLMFTKTDLASSENSWDEKPHLVSRGGQKNFLQFMVDNDAEHTAEVASALDEPYYQRLIARLIVFRKAQHVARQLAFPAYRANIVTYTVAYLAKYAHRALDQDRIWLDQDVPEVLVSTLRKIEPIIDKEIKRSAGERNVTEWCKKEECWKHIRGLDIDLPKSFWPRGAPKSQTTQARAGQTESGASMNEREVQLFAALRELDLQVVDDRPNGGDLWIVGGAEMRQTMLGLLRKGAAFAFAPQGHQATQDRPAWRFRRAH